MNREESHRVYGSRKEPGARKPCEYERENKKNSNNYSQPLISGYQIKHNKNIVKIISTKSVNETVYLREFKYDNS